MFAEDEGDGDRGDDVGQQHAHAPEGLGAHVLVEHRGDERARRSSCGMRESRKMLKVLQSEFQKNGSLSIAT